MGPFLVATAGRSGSSFVCRVLAERFGVDWGDVAPPTRANPEGAYECSRLRWLNKARARGEIGRARWEDGIGSLCALRIVEHLGSWGWKDPGLAPYMSEALEIIAVPNVPELNPPKIIWPQRNVAACARSRARWYTDTSEKRWLDKMAGWWTDICAALEGREHLRLDFDRRWTEDELEGAIRAWLEAREPVGEVA